MNYIGMDLGSTSAKVAVLDGEEKLIYQQVTPTGWNCVETARGLLEQLHSCGFYDGGARCVATGYGRVSAPGADKTVTEITCHGKGAVYLFGPEPCTVIDIGGQDTKIISVEGGMVKNFVMNDKCSAGTGRFLEIMSGTMGVSLAELCELAQQSTVHLNISSMCTVFAESEVVSLIGQGAEKADIARGVVESIAEKVKSQVGKAQGTCGRYCLTGGLCEIPFVRRVLSEKLGSEVISDPLARYAGAIGAALSARSLR
jgi:predicted CoA-substrate-specific enzyme activase